MKDLNTITRPLFFIVLSLAVLILLKSFLIPFLYGLLIALIVYPVCRKLESHKVPKSAAITLSILLVVLVFGGVVLLLALQINAIKRELPALIIHFSGLAEELRNWLEINFGLSLADQGGISQNLKKNFSDNMVSILTGSFSIAAMTLFNLIIIPIYSILILYYRRSLVTFLSAIAGEEYKKDLAVILYESTHLYFNYIKGMLWVYIIVGILNSTGLLILGVDYAVVFGMVSAFMTIIPYIGIIISGILPVALIWAETNNIWYPIGVVAVFAFVQYLEANLIFPYIVGKQLGLNTFISIVVILLGAALWGISGMILFLPFLGMLKIVSGHINQLRPLHDLLEINK